MQSHIYIPVMDSAEVVAVDLGALPDEPETLLEILAAEASPLCRLSCLAITHICSHRPHAGTQTL